MAVVIRMITPALALARSGAIKSAAISMQRRRRRRRRREMLRSPTGRTFRGDPSVRHWLAEPQRYDAERWLGHLGTNQGRGSGQTRRRVPPYDDDDK